MIDDKDDEPDRDEDHEDEPTIACPYCRDEIHEDSSRCPSCGSWISREDAPARKPWWLILGVIACLWAVARWVGLL